jgi:hypothetical protein
LSSSAGGGFSLSGRVALVTGASRGMGRATAVELARGGAAVALVGRDRQRPDDVAALYSCVRPTGDDLDSWSALAKDYHLDRSMLRCPCRRLWQCWTSFVNCSSVISALSTPRGSAPPPVQSTWLQVSNRGCPCDCERTVRTHAAYAISGRFRHRSTPQSAQVPCVRSTPAGLGEHPPCPRYTRQTSAGSALPREPGGVAAARVPWLALEVSPVGPLQSVCAR